MSASGSLVISAPPGPRTEDLLRQLHAELRRAGIVSEPVSSSVPVGSKSGGGTLASLVLSGLVSAAGLRVLAQVLLATVRRAEKRRIEIRRGDDVFILDGASSRDGHAALEGWLRTTGPIPDIDES